MSDKLMIFGDPVDEGAVEQMETCLADERARFGALMADHHRGYSMPIGGVIVYEGAVSPSGVGFDIACGNKAVRTELRWSETFEDSPLRFQAFMKEIQHVIAFGVGRTSGENLDHPIFDDPLWPELETAPGEPLKQKARQQLGTVGSGNHYVDILVDEDDFIWVACHFGSRGFGHTVASGFLAVAQGKTLADRVKETEEPAMLDVASDAGQLYLAAMLLAGKYAYAGRDYVVDQVLRLLDHPATGASIHCHHNYAWLENGLWVVRKGATPLSNVPAFIGGSMGDVSVVVRGVYVDNDSPKRTIQDIGAWGSAPHGAGRQMSRTQAAGKWMKVPEERERPDGTKYTFKRRVRNPETAAIDWKRVKHELEMQKIIVLGAGADEAPGAYKDLRSVLAHHPNVQIVHRLHPRGVVMAGDDVYDPYQD